MTGRTISVAAFLGLAMVLRTSAGLAEGALAVGLPGDSPRSGGFVYATSIDKATAEEARETALKDCRGVDVRDTSKARKACKVIETFRNQCMNAAFNGDKNTTSTAVGWGIGPDSATANSRAMVMCTVVRQGNGKPCHLDGDPVCDGDAK